MEREAPAANSSSVFWESGSIQLLHPILAQIRMLVGENTVHQSLSF